MYIGRIEPDFVTESVAPDAAKGTRASFLAGLALLVIAIPYWSARLVVSALWRDVRRVGRVVRLLADSYSDALARR